MRETFYRYRIASTCSHLVQKRKWGKKVSYANGWTFLAFLVGPVWSVGPRSPLLPREVLTLVCHVSRFFFPRCELPWYASRSQTRIIHMDLKQRVYHIGNASCALFTFCLASDRIGPRYYTIRGSIPAVDGSVIFVFLEWLWNHNPDVNPS